MTTRTAIASEKRFVLDMFSPCVRFGGITTPLSVPFQGGKVLHDIVGPVQDIDSPEAGRGSSAEDKVEGMRSA
jgi:hypothetical protein